jgi:hypothetical protein
MHYGECLDDERMTRLGVIKAGLLTLAARGYQLGKWLCLALVVISLSLTSKQARSLNVSSLAPVPVETAESERSQDSDAEQTERDESVVVSSLHRASRRCYLIRWRGVVDSGPAQIRKSRANPQQAIGIFLTTSGRLRC